MKKTLIITLALVFVLGLAGTAFANPYSDVPAGHWAYKAVTDLTKAGIVEGYQGKYRGQDNMTRYEMAAITARAMAKADKADAAQKATIDKLAVEFSKELNDLGVRVAKLEKNQSNFKWAGDYRMRWVDADAADGNTNTQHRLRLSATAKVNDDVTAYVRIMAFDHKNLGQWAGSDVEKDKFGSDMDIVDINATWKGLFGSDSMTFGRFSHKMGQLGYYLDSTGKIDGFKGTWSLGDNTKLNVGFADFGAINGTLAKDAVLGNTSNEIGWAEVTHNFSDKLKVSALYVKPASLDYKVIGGGFGYAFDKDWALAADFQQEKVYGVNLNDTHARLSYKGAKAAEVGSWGAFFEYAKFEGIQLETGSSTNLGANTEQMTVSFSTTLAKNVVFDSYYSFDRKNAITGADKADETYTRAQVNFLF